MTEPYDWGELTDFVSPICPFPKYKYRLWVEVVSEDRKYVEWLVSGEGPEMSDALYDHLMDLLEKTS